MSTEHGDPEDGDLVESAPDVRRPRRGQRGDPDLDPLGRRRPRPRRPARHAAASRASLARICPRLCRGPGGPSARTFEEVGGYDEIVLLKDIPFQSHCEHHMAPIIGKASIAYLPRDKVVGISKLARVLHGFARRLQVQERLTAQVADTIWEHLQPKGVAVVIEASHALHDRARGQHAGRDDDHQPDDGHLPRGRAKPARGAGADGLLVRRGSGGCASCWKRGTECTELGGHCWNGSGAVGGAGATLAAMQTLGLTVPTPASAADFMLPPGSGSGKSVGGARRGIAGLVAATVRRAGYTIAVRSRPGAGSAAATSCPAMRLSRLIGLGARHRFLLHLFQCGPGVILSGTTPSSVTPSGPMSHGNFRLQSSRDRLYFVGKVHPGRASAWTASRRGCPSFSAKAIDVHAPLTLQIGHGHRLDVIFAIHIMGASSIMGSINIITTILDLRAPRMTMMKMPLFCWAWLITAYLLIR